MTDLGPAPVGSSRWDAQRAQHATHTAFQQPRTCIRCRRDCRPRYLYCSDECSAASRAELAALRKDAA